MNDESWQNRSSALLRQFNAQIKKLSLEIEMNATTEILMQRAMYYLGCLQPERADQDFKKAINLFKEESFLSKKYPQKLVELYFKRAEGYLRYFEKWMEHFKMPISDRDFSKLLLYYSEVIENSFKGNDFYTIKAYRKLGEFYYQIGKFGESIEALESIKRIKRSLGAEDKTLLMLNFYELGKSEEAKDLAVSIINLTGDWRYLESAAFVLTKINEIELAIEAYSKVLKIDGMNKGIPDVSARFIENDRKGDCYVKRGMLKYELGNESGAFDDFIKAYEEDSTIGRRYKEVFDHDEFKTYLKENHYK